MASSDIIKIGFDYRASLEQFEKDTNGVFDGIRTNLNWMQKEMTEVTNLENKKLQFS